jgi:hypothetical protein
MVPCGAHRSSVQRPAEQYSKRMQVTCVAHGWPRQVAASASYVSYGQRVRAILGCPRDWDALKHGSPAHGFFWRAESFESFDCLSAYTFPNGISDYGHVVGAYLAQNLARLHGVNVNREYAEVFQVYRVVA